MPTTHAVAAVRDDQDPAAERRALEIVRRQIARDYPWAAEDHIAELLHTGYRQTEGAKVQNYRLVLAERDVRVRLRHEQRDRAARESSPPQLAEAV